MPKNGVIHANVVSLLLTRRKKNGEFLVDPAQTFYGLKPADYVSGLLSEKKLIRQLKAAERRYAAAVGAETKHETELGAIAADRQNAHNRKVIALSRSNFQRLYEHYYGAKGKKKASELAITKMLGR